MKNQPLIQMNKNGRIMLIMQYKYLWFFAMALISCNIANNNKIANNRKFDQNDTTYRYSFNLIGDTTGITPVVNGKANGWSRTYYDNGQLHCLKFLVDDKIEGPAVTFTENGDTAVKEIWRNGFTYEILVFWQEVPFTNGKKFYCLSDEGIYRMKDGEVINWDENPPEGLIIEKLSPDGSYSDYYVYKNGKLELYPNPRVKKQEAR